MTSSPPNNHGRDYYHVWEGPYDADGKMVPIDEALRSLLRSPAAYEERFVLPRPSNPKLPLPLDEVATLKIFERNNKAFSAVGPGGVAQVPQGVGFTIPPAVAGDDDLLWRKDPLKWDDLCSEALGEHFSDVTLHYYCQIPKLYRGCYRILLRIQEAEFVDVVHSRASGGPKSVDDIRNGALTVTKRETLRDRCLKPFDTWTDEEKTSMLDVMEEFARPMQQLIVEAFQAFYPTQRLDPSDPASANAFDYFMMSETFAFSYESQQKALNRFYASLQPADSGGKPLDLAGDAMACKRERPPRFLDLPNENFCAVSTPKERPLKSAGR